MTESSQKKSDQLMGQEIETLLGNLLPTQKPDPGFVDKLKSELSMSPLFDSKHLYIPRWLIIGLGLLIGLVIVILKRANSTNHE